MKQVIIESPPALKVIEKITLDQINENKIYVFYSNVAYYKLICINWNPKQYYWANLNDCIGRYTDEKFNSLYGAVTYILKDEYYNVYEFNNVKEFAEWLRDEEVRNWKPNKINNTESYHKVIEIIDDYHIRINKTNIDEKYGNTFLIGDNYGKLVLIEDNSYVLESINEIHENNECNEISISGEIMITKPIKIIEKFKNIEIGDIVR